MITLDPQTLAVMTAMCAIISYFFKRDIKRTDKQLSEQKVEIEDSKKQHKECMEDRDLMRISMEETDLELGKIKTLLVVVGECPAEVCPSKKVLNAVVTHSIMGKN